MLDKLMQSMRPVLYILETGLGISQSNRDADSQWNLFHN